MLDYLFVIKCGCLWLDLLHAEERRHLDFLLRNHLFNAISTGDIGRVHFLLIRELAIEVVLPWLTVYGAQLLLPRLHLLLGHSPLNGEPLQRLVP